MAKELITEQERKKQAFDKHLVEVIKLQDEFKKLEAARLEADTAWQEGLTKLESAKKNFFPIASKYWDKKAQSTHLVRVDERMFLVHCRFVDSASVEEIFEDKT